MLKSTRGHRKGQNSNTVAVKPPDRKFNKTPNTSPWDNIHDQFKMPANHGVLHIIFKPV